jgi:hypothetical protein
LFKGDDTTVGEKRGDFGSVFGEVMYVEVKVEFLVKSFVE